MKLVLTPFFVLIFSATLVSCSNGSSNNVGDGSGNGPEKQNIQFIKSYSLGADCSTGKQTFSAMTEDVAQQKLCEGLQNETLNNFCSQVERADYFSTQCKGEFVSFITHYPSEEFGNITPESALEKFRCEDGVGPVFNFVFPDFNSNGIAISLTIQPNGVSYKAKIDTISNYKETRWGVRFAPTLHSRVEGQVSIVNGRYKFEDIGTAEFSDPKDGKVPVLILALEDQPVFSLMNGPSHPKAIANRMGSDCTP